MNIFGSEETRFVNTFHKLLNPSIQLLTSEIWKTAFLNESDRVKEMISEENSNAAVSIVWSACAYGAYILMDARCADYISYSRKALDDCFDYPSNYVVQAFLCLEIVSRIYGSCGIWKKNIIAKPSMDGNDRPSALNGLTGKYGRMATILDRQMQPKMSCDLALTALPSTQTILYNVLKAWEFIFESIQSQHLNFDYIQKWWELLF